IFGSVRALNGSRPIRIARSWLSRSRNSFGFCSGMSCGVGADAAVKGTDNSRTATSKASVFIKSNYRTQELAMTCYGRRDRKMRGRQDGTNGKDGSRATRSKIGRSEQREVNRKDGTASGFQAAQASTVGLDRKPHHRSSAAAVLDSSSAYKMRTEASPA